MRFCLLIMAKSPIPGQVKTRLCPPLTPEEAADVAAAALLDTVEAALATPGAVPVVALAGVVRREDVRDALAECVVIPQRGLTFAERLVHAHADVARFGMPVLQIGMDTPQVTPSLLESCAEFDEAALGFALDGGWWALGLRDPLRAEVLRDVPMSRADTGARTLEALQGWRTLDALLHTRAGRRGRRTRPTGCGCARCRPCPMWTPWLTLARWRPRHRAAGSPRR